MSTESTGGQLIGQWAAVTGGSKGIGNAIAHRFVKAGANAVLIARGQAALDASVADLQAVGGPDQQVIGITADIAERASLSALFAEMGDRIPHLNTFVANAGTGRLTPFLEITGDEWDEVVALNLTGTFFSCQYAARLMVERPASNQSILVISSIRGKGALAKRSHYSATKAAVNQFARVAALEVAEHDIRVNVLSPGITRTPLVVDGGNEAVLKELEEGIPLRRAGEPEDMGEAALFLCSPQGKFITGINLVVDGGELIG